MRTVMVAFGVTLAIAISTTLPVTGTIAQGQSRGVGPPGADQTPYFFATTFLQTLSFAATARDALAETSSSTGDPIADSLKAIVAQRGAVSRLKLAITLIDQFRTTRDESVRKAADDLTNVYRVLADRLLSAVVIYEKLAKTKTTDDLAALVPEAGKLAAEVEEAWRLLPLGAASVSHALTDLERLTDGKVSRLRLTRAERVKLNDEIVALFPNAKPEQKGGQVVDVTVNLFRGFLNQPWKSSDDR